tara:strand:- start:288 stop:485 length:198 start_codon:yes stop_codon:yes gene_type:complete
MRILNARYPKYLVAQSQIAFENQTDVFERTHPEKFQAFDAGQGRVKFPPLGLQVKLVIFYRDCSL